LRSDDKVEGVERMESFISSSVSVSESVSESVVAVSVAVVQVEVDFTSFMLSECEKDELDPTESSGKRF